MAKSQSRQLAIKNMMEAIRERLTTSPADVYQLANEFGLSQATTNRYIRLMVQDGLIQPHKVVSRRILYMSSTPSIIPMFRSSSGQFGSAMNFVLNIRRAPFNKGKLEQLLENWNKAFMMLFAQARYVERTGQIDEQIKTESMKYFNQLRQELNTRLEMVNAILSNEKWWVTEELSEFPKDTSWNSEAIDEAWLKVTNPNPVP